jgi:hypothetical protein
LIRGIWGFKHKSRTQTPNKNKNVLYNASQSLELWKLEQPAIPFSGSCTQEASLNLFAIQNLRLDSMGRLGDQVPVSQHSLPTLSIANN